MSVRLGRKLDLSEVKPSDLDPLVYRVDQGSQGPDMGSGSGSSARR